MVDSQILARGVRDPRVLTAMRKVPRHEFVDPAQRASAYEDHPLPIAGNQTISQPYIVALMTELLELPPELAGSGDRHGIGIPERRARGARLRGLLDRDRAGAGPLGGRELRELGYPNVIVREGDGYRGWPEHAPFDGIIVTAAPERIPQPLLDQLSPGGRMVIPVGGFFQELKVFTKGADGRITEKDIIPGAFRPDDRGDREREDPGGPLADSRRRGSGLSTWGQVWTLSNWGQVSIRPGRNASARRPPGQRKGPASRRARETPGFG